MSVTEAQHRTDLTFAEINEHKVFFLVLLPSFLSVLFVVGLFTFIHMYIASEKLSRH